MAERRLKTPDGSDYVPPVGLHDEGLDPEDQSQFSGPLTEKQYRFLRAGIREELRANGNENPEKAQQIVTDYFSEVFGFSKPQAKEMFKKCKEALENLPMTITVDADKMFGNDGNPAFSKDYSPTQIHSKKIEDDVERFGEGAAGSEGKTRSMNPGVTDRGDQYARWREEKDERETGGNSFMPDEAARFGAVNVNFPRSSGGQGSSYGRDHLVMKDSLKSVSTFCFTTAGEERRDMSVILMDMVRNPRGKKYLSTLLNNVSGNDKSANLTDLDLEFHCYGPIDLTRDVTQISVPSPDTTDDPEEKERLEFLHKKVSRFSEGRMDAPIQWKDIPQDDNIRFDDALDEARVASRGVSKKDDPEFFDCELRLDAYYAGIPGTRHNLNYFTGKKDEYIDAAETFLQKYKSDKSKQDQCKKVKKDLAEVKAHHKAVMEDFAYEDEIIIEFFEACNTLCTVPNGERALKFWPSLSASMDGIRKLGKDKKRPDEKVVKERAKAAVERAIKLCELSGEDVPDDLTRMQATLAG
jgi:hypothetical protein